MIDKVGEKCFGCMACKAICPKSAITLKRTNTGFDYPLIDGNLCIECNLCEQVCPSLQNHNLQRNIESFAAYSECKPNESSSGGAFYSIAHYVIKNGGCVYGAVFDTTKKIVHARVDNTKNLIRLCGSKYVQSEIGEDIWRQVKQDLKSAKIVLFSGTPCQISGLKLFLRKDYSNLITIDLVCHGVPSPKLFSDYLIYCEKLRFKKITNFIFRDNRDGWSNVFKSTIEYKDGSVEYNSALSNLWNRIFFSELCTRDSCRTCKFASTNRVGDITLGDFWGIDKIVKYDDQRGVSLLLCNTKTGFEVAKASGLVLFPAQTNSKEHPNLFHPTPPNQARHQFQKYYETHGFKKTIKKFFGFSLLLDLKIRLYNIILKNR